MSSPLDNLAPPQENPLDSLPPPPTLAQSDPSEYDPSSAAYQQKYGELPDVAPTGIGPLDSFATFARNAALGYGRAFSRTGLAARQMVGAAGPNEYQNLQGTDRALMNTYGGMAGNALGVGAQVAPMAMLPGAGTVLGGALIGGIGASFQPTATPSQRLVNQGVGFLGGAAMQKVTNGAMDYFGGDVPSNFMAPEADASAQQQAIARGESIGMKTTPGQRSGSVAQQQFEARLASSPYTSGPFNAINEQNQNVVGSQWARAIGEGGSDVSGRVMGNAAERTGDVFNSVRDPNSILATDPQSTSGVLDKIDQDYLGLLPGDSIRSNPLVARLESLTQGGAVNGEQLGNLSSNLGKAAYQQMTGQGGNRQMGMALNDVKDHVDDMVESTLSGNDLSDYLSAKSQYRALMQLNARTGNVNPDTGRVNAVNMASYLQKADRSGYTFGNNESPQYDALRFMNATRPVVGNSGTATRSPEGLTGMVMAPFGRFLSKSYLGGSNSGLLYNLIGRPLGAGIRGAVAAPGAFMGAADAAGGALAPYAQAGLPGMAGTAAPYLLQ